MALSPSGGDCLFAGAAALVGGSISLSRAGGVFRSNHGRSHPLRHSSLRKAPDRRRLHRQAETLAEEHVALLNANPATKVDIEALQQQTRASIEAVKADLLKWLFGALIAQGGLIVALVKLL